MNSIIAYHPCVNVRLESGCRWVFTADLADWVSDEDFLELLQSSLGADDLSSLVNMVKSGAVVAGVNNLRVSKVS